MQECILECTLNVHSSVYILECSLVYILECSLVYILQCVLQCTHTNLSNSPLNLCLDLLTAYSFPSSLLLTLKTWNEQLVNNRAHKGKPLPPHLSKRPFPELFNDIKTLYQRQVQNSKSTDGVYHPSIPHFLPLFSPSFLHPCFPHSLIPLHPALSLESLLLSLFIPLSLLSLFIPLSLSFHSPIHPSSLPSPFPTCSKKDFCDCSSYNGLTKATVYKVHVMRQHMLGTWASNNMALRSYPLKDSLHKLTGFLLRLEADKLRLIILCVMPWGVEHPRCRRARLCRGSRRVGSGWSPFSMAEWRFSQEHVGDRSWTMALNIIHVSIRQISSF